MSTNYHVRETSMFSALQRWGIRILLPAGACVLLLSAEPAWAQGRLQNRQNVHCLQNGAQGHATAQRQLRTLQNGLRQLNTLQQNGQLTPAQLQAVDQLQSALQNALQQLSGLQSSLTPSQLQTLGQQQTALAWQLRAAPMLGHR
jgi:hypothetical protein